MNILYIHGWGSKFDSSNDKVTLLSNCGEVFGVNVDYTKTFEQIKETVYNAMVANKIDLIVGTSMGGYMAHKMGTECSVPYVMINPATDPATTLQKYLGSGVDYYNQKYTLHEDTLTSFPPMSDSENVPALLLLDMDDDVCDANNTNQIFKTSKCVTTNTWTNGSHRFDHMEESIPLINAFEGKNLSYGFGAN